MFTKVTGLVPSRFTEITPFSLKMWVQFILKVISADYCQPAAQTGSFCQTQIHLLGKSCCNSQFPTACVTKFLLLPPELGRLQQPKWYVYFPTTAFLCSLSPVVAVRHFISLPYRKIGSEWREILTSQHAIYSYSHICLRVWLKLQSRRDQTGCFILVPKPVERLALFVILHPTSNSWSQSQLLFFVHLPVLWEQVMYSYPSPPLLWHCFSD